MSFHKITLYLTIGYLVIVSGFLLWHGSWFSPDQFFAAALLGALLLGRTRLFIQDWAPLTALLLGYEYLRALVPKLGISPHIFPMINFDKALFGFIPSVKLQNVLFTPGNYHWYDYVAVFVYISYFVAPFLTAFLFWIFDHPRFREYSLAILLLAYSGFITFIIFPAMPPWMAAEKSFIPPLLDIGGKISTNFPAGISLPTVYRFIGANLVAAVPSLHAAYPWLIFLFVSYKNRLWGLLSLLYVFAVWFAVVYLGDHYVFDIVAGVFYATVAFLVVVKRERILSFISGLTATIKGKNHFRSLRKSS